MNVKGVQKNVMAEKLRVIDLRSQIGGRSLGFQRAGYDIVCAVDSTPMCEAIYNKIIENKRFVLSDIEYIMPDELPYNGIVIYDTSRDIS